MQRWVLGTQFRCDLFLGGSGGRERRAYNSINVMFSITTILDPEVLNEIKWSKIILDKAVVPHRKRLPLTEALFFTSCNLELVTLNNYKNSHAVIISYKPASKTGFLNFSVKCKYNLIMKFSIAKTPNFTADVNGSPLNLLGQNY